MTDLNKAMHVSAPKGHKCADCSIDEEPCPTCYAAWWTAKHPNTTLIEPVESGQDLGDKMTEEYLEAETQHMADRKTVESRRGTSEDAKFTENVNCRGKDPLCPCQDGDMCHYEGPDAWPLPVESRQKCPECGQDVGSATPGCQMCSAESGQQPGCSLCHDPRNHMSLWLGTCPRCKREIPTADREL